MGLVIHPCNLTLLLALVTFVISSSTFGLLVVTLGNRGQRRCDGRQHLGAMGRDLVPRCKPARELLWRESQKVLLSDWMGSERKRSQGWLCGFGLNHGRTVLP